jgi:ankyrin repeat protein
MSDEDGDTALMLATQNGYLDVVNDLIEHGADVNVHGVQSLHMIYLILIVSVT